MELSSHASVCAGKNLTCENRSVVVNMLTAFFHLSDNGLRKKRLRRKSNVCFNEGLPMIADTRLGEIKSRRTAVNWCRSIDRDGKSKIVTLKLTWQRLEVPGESEVLSFSRTLCIPGYLLKRRNFINPSGSAFHFFISAKQKPSNHYITALLWMARANLTGEKLLYVRSR